MPSQLEGLVGGNTRDGSTPFSRITKTPLVGVFAFKGSSATSPHLALGGQLVANSVANCALLRRTQGFRTRARSTHRRSARPLILVAVGASDTQANFLRRPREISVPGHHDNFFVPQFERGRQMDRVVTAQPQVFGVLAGTNREFVIDADGNQIPIQGLKACERLTVLIRPEPIQSPGSHESRPALWIGEDARCRRMGTSPKLGCQLGPVLNDHELDQRRGVEVEDQARCSETRSETEPALFTWAERGRRLPCGIRTRPR